MVAQADRLGDLAQGAGAHERGMAAGELALALAGEAAQQQIGHGQRQHAVAQEFQALVAVREGGLQVGALVEGAAMGQRLDGELGALEGMAEPVAQRREIDVARSHGASFSGCPGRSG